MTTLLEDLIVYRDELVVTERSFGRALNVYEVGQLDMLTVIIEDLSEIIDEQQRQSNDVTR